MASGRSGNGGGLPPDDGLPDLPPEWGVVVIPDDLTELDRETVELRRERRRLARRNRWRGRFGLAPVDPTADAPPVGAPLLIMSIAIIAALTSLFAITLSTRSTTVPPTPKATPVAPATAQQMIDLALLDAAGQQVRLRDTLPAVILLLDGCRCDQLIEDTARLAPTKVTLLIVDRVAPIIPIGVNATALADPEQALLATYADGPDRGATPAGTAAAVLVGADGTVTLTAYPATKIADFSAQLAQLH